MIYSEAACLPRGELADRAATDAAALFRRQRSPHEWGRRGSVSAHGRSLRRRCAPYQERRVVGAVCRLRCACSSAVVSAAQVIVRAVRLDDTNEKHFADLMRRGQPPPRVPEGRIVAIISLMYCAGEAYPEGRTGHKSILSDARRWLAGLLARILGYQLREGGIGEAC